MAMYSLFSPKTNIDSIYVKIYLFIGFFLLLVRILPSTLGNLILVNDCWGQIAEVKTVFIHATTRTLNSVQLLCQVQWHGSTTLEEFHFCTFHYNEKPISCPLAVTAFKGFQILFMKTFLKGLCGIMHFRPKN